MNRRFFLKHAALASAGLTLPAGKFFATETNGETATPAGSTLAAAIAKDWQARWEDHILGEIHHRYCDTESGEELGWLLSPFLNGFYYGYQFTKDVTWVEHLSDWTESWIKRAVKEPDGYLGWPKSGTGGVTEKEFLTASLLGEAMTWRPVVLMAKEILQTPSLSDKFGANAKNWLALAGKTFEKWDARACWREVKGGGVWVVPEFGIDPKTGGWTEGYARRATEGFSNPDNKQNQIARWLLAMHDATGETIYRDRAGLWFRLMKSRMHTREDGKYFVWNYWEPAGPWDYQADGSTRHWVGVHPNGGYYILDVEAIVEAYEHKLVFDREDIQRLIATNRDFMWNHQIQHAAFQRIDGGQPDSRWAKTPGVLWTWLTPYDDTLRKIFIANNDPSSWAGLIATPWFLAREQSVRAR